MKKNLILSFLILPFLWVGLGKMQAQTLNWQGDPNLIGTLNQMSDTAAVIRVHFIVNSAPLNNGAVRIALPAGIKYAGKAVTGPAHTAPTITATVSPTLDTVVMTFANTISLNQHVELLVSVVSECRTSETFSPSITVLRNGVALEAAKTPILDCPKPAITVTAIRSSTASLAAVNDVDSLILAVSVMDGTASGLDIILTCENSEITLSNFKYGGNPLLANKVGNVYTVSLPAPITTTAEQLIFKVSSSAEGTQSITYGYKYPTTAANCASNNYATTLSIKNPTTIGSPNFNFLENRPIKGFYDNTPITNANDICMNGVDNAWYRVVIANNGTGTAYTPRIEARAYNVQSGLGYFSTDSLFYSIGKNGVRVQITDANATITKGGQLAHAPTYRLKPSAFGQYSIVDIKLNSNLPAGDTIYYYFPLIQGDLYDNSALTTSSAKYGAQLYYQILYIIDNTCFHDALGNVSSQLVYPTVSTYCGYYPKFTSMIASQFFSEANEQVTISIPFATGISPNTTAGGTRTNSDFYVKLPSWLKLQSTVEGDSIKFDGPNTSVNKSVKDLGNNTYKINILSTTGDNLSNVTLKCQTIGDLSAYPTNQDTVIKYWIDVNLGSNPTTPAGYRPTLETFAVLYQNVSLLVQKDNILMKPIEWERVSRGYADADNNAIPDHPLTQASAGAIDNQAYIVRDTGILKLKGYVIAPTDTFRYLYATLSASNNQMLLQSNNSRVINILQNELSVHIKKGNTVQTLQTVVYNRYTKDNSKIYFSIPLLGYALSKDDTVTVEIPFTIVSPKNSSIDLTAELFVTDTNVMTLPSPEDSIFKSNFIYRKGHDRRSTIFRTYSENIRCLVNPGSSFSFNSIATTRIAFTNLYNFGSTGLSAYADINFPYEVRHLIKQRQYILTLPQGYELANNDTLEVDAESEGIHMTKYGAKYTFTIAKLGVESKVLNADGSTSYTYNLSSLYDPDFTDNTPVGTGKYPYPDAFYRYRMYANLVVTPGATSQTVPIKSRQTNTLNANDTLRTHDIVFSYGGPGVVITPSPTTLYTEDEKMKLNSLQIGYTHGQPVNGHIWLYIAGNVQNCVANLNAVTYTGVGPEGRWIDLGTFSPADNKDYTLSFDYLGSSNCAGDTITIYAVLDYAVNPALHTIDDIPAMNRGYSYVKILPPSATIGGSLSVSNNRISYMQNYDLTLNINSAQSQGLLKDLKFDLVIPKGQLYVANSLEVTFDGVTTPLGATALEALFLAENANTTNDRTIADLELDDFLQTPGFMLPGINAGKPNTVTIRATFKPDCNSSLTGFRFSADIYANNSCSDPATGNGRKLNSQQMYSSVNTNFTFSFVSSFQSGNYAFNELLTEDTLVFTLTKIPDIPGENLTPSDSIQVTLPSYLNVNGNIEGSSVDFLYNEDINTYSNTNNGLTRTITFHLPTNEYNNEPSAGDNLSVTYKFPLKYTVDNVVINNPVTDINIDVVASAIFDPACSHSVPITIGYDQIAVAVLNAVDNPHEICYNTLDSIVINTLDFGGQFYSDQALINLLPSSATALPYRSTTAGDITFYVSAVVDAVFYGYVPIKFNVRDSIGAKITPSTYIVLDTLLSVTAPVSVKSTTAVEVFYLYSNSNDPLDLDTLSFTVPQGVNSFTWNIDYKKKNGIYYYRLLEIVDAFGCVQSLNKNDSIIVKVAQCNPDSTFSLAFTSHLINLFPYGKCDTVVDFGTATVPFHWLERYEIDPRITLTSDVAPGTAFLPGVNRIIWTAIDTCGVTVIDTQFVVINLSPCDGKDTLWNIDGTFNVINPPITVSDVEANVYTPVRVGCDCWTKENLKSTTYGAANGGGNITDDLVYSSAAYPDRVTNWTTFGRLYTWKDATKNGTSQGICPDGWMLPSAAHYAALQTYGAYAISAPGGDYWLGAPATNTTDFSALPAGYYQGSSSAYHQLLGDTYFWTSEIGTTTIGKACHLHYGCPDIVITDFNKLNGGSVRCVKSN